METLVVKSDDGVFVMNTKLRLSEDGKVATRQVERKNPEGGSKRTEVFEKQ
jgi:hypothetical protein